MKSYNNKLFIHNNPVEAEFVENESDCLLSRIGEYEENTGGIYTYFLD